MTPQEQYAFLRELINAAAGQVMTMFYEDRIPRDWTGKQLRALVEDIFKEVCASERFLTRKERQAYESSKGE